jgi:nitrate/nitrite transport system permease protein
MRISIGIAWLVIVAAEMLVSGTGIRLLRLERVEQPLHHHVITAILFIGVIGMLLDQLMAKLQPLVAYAD